MKTIGIIKACEHWPELPVRVSKGVERKILKEANNNVLIQGMFEGLKASRRDAAHRGEGKSRRSIFAAHYTYPGQVTISPTREAKLWARITFRKAPEPVVLDREIAGTCSCVAFCRDYDIHIYLFEEVMKV